MPPPFVCALCRSRLCFQQFRVPVLRRSLQQHAAPEAKSSRSRNEAHGISSSTEQQRTRAQDASEYSQAVEDEYILRLQRDRGSRPAANIYSNPPAPPPRVQASSQTAHLSRPPLASQDRASLLDRRSGRHIDRSKETADQPRIFKSNLSFSAASGGFDGSQADQTSWVAQTIKYEPTPRNRGSTAQSNIVDGLKKKKNQGRGTVSTGPYRSAKIPLAEFISVNLHGHDDACATQLDVLGQDLPFTHKKPLPTSARNNPSTAAERTTTLLSTLFELPVDAYTRDLDLNLNPTDPKIFEKDAILLFNHLVHRWCTDPAAHHLPAPSTLFRLMRKKIEWSDWQVLWRSCTIILVRETFAMVAGTKQPRASISEAMLDEVLNMWTEYAMHFSKERRSHGLRLKIWSALSGKEAVDSSILTNTDISARWWSVFNRPSSRHEHIEALAALSLVAFRLMPAKRPRRALESAHFQDFVLRLTANANLDNKKERYCDLINLGGSQELKDRFLQELGVLAATSTKEVAESQSANSHGPQYTSTTLPESGGQGSPPDVRMRNARAKVRHAVQERSAPRLERAWAQTVVAYGNGDPGSPTEQIPVSVYSAFISGFIKLRQPSQASRVWNHMLARKVEPDLVAWDKIIRACAAVRDLSLVDAIWNGLRQSGVQPDLQLWNTYLYCLVSGKWWNSAWTALREMIREWREQRPGQGGINAPKPGITTINILVTGLAQSADFTRLGEVLKLATDLGLQPDIYTFNPLFQAALLEGNTVLLERLFAKVQALGIQPDVATFTVLLGAIYQGDRVEDASTNVATRDRTDQEQAAVSQLFEAMGQKGINANAYVFTTLVSNLLHAHNAEAAYGVLEYMRSHNAPMSPALYTAFITHHLRKAKPDLDAVETLWNEARQGRIQLDVIFFDRLIEGFSRAGELGKALTALTQASNLRLQPGWGALNEIVHGLVQAGDETRAQEIVGAVVRESQHERRSGTREAEDAFWALVDKHGLGPAPAGNASVDMS